MVLNTLWERNINYCILYWDCSSQSFSTGCCNPKGEYSTTNL